MIEDVNELFNEGGCIPVWEYYSKTNNRPYYKFKLTEKDSYALFPTISKNPKAPKFQLRKLDSSMYNKETGETEKGGVEF